MKLNYPDKKAQLKATKVRDKLSCPPPRKNTISEIITEEEDENGTSKQVKHKGQLRAQNAISEFYTQLYSHNICDDKLENIEEFLKGIKHEEVSQEENDKLIEEIT